MVVTLLPGTALRVPVDRRARCAIGRELLRPWEVADLVGPVDEWALRSGRDFVDGVAAFVGAIPYASDPPVDVWQSPALTRVRRAGDCEDHALMAASVLDAADVPVAMILGTLDGKGHAWVEGYDEHGWFLLEATPPAAGVYRYFAPGYVADQIIWSSGCAIVAA